MPSNRAPTDAALRTAADLRAAGNAWEAVAAGVGLPAETVRRWPQRYPVRWRKALDASARRTLSEANAEAVTVLRTQLRSKDEKTVREAAHKLVQIHVALTKVRRPTKGGAKQSSPPGYADRLVNYVRGKTREQLIAGAVEPESRAGAD